MNLDGKTNSQTWYIWLWTPIYHFTTLWTFTKYFWNCCL